MKPALPSFISPMLATPGSFFHSSEYLYEPKWDGLRCLAFRNSELRFMSRNGRSMTTQFPELGAVEHSVSGDHWILDGELIVLDSSGKPSFDLARNRNLTSDPPRIAHQAKAHPALFAVFDVLYHDGESLMDKPLFARRRLLEERINASQCLIISPAMIGARSSFHQTVVRQGFEGTLIKKLDSRYIPGHRSKHWIKVRDVEETDCVIGGFTARNSLQFSSLLVGQYLRSDRLRYVGRVGTGFSEADSKALTAILRRIAVPASPFDTAESRPRQQVVWVRPLIVCRIEFLTWTPNGLLRHPVFRSIRTDKTALECTMAPHHPLREGEPSP